MAGVGYDWRMTHGRRQAALELTIGVVGSADLVERIMLSGTATSGAGHVRGHRGKQRPGAGRHATAPVTRRLVAVVYRNEQEAGDKVLRLGPGIDVWLFASRIPYLYARQAGVLRKPATYVPLGGSALYAALLRAARKAGDHDLSRLSVDVLSRAEVEDAFADMGLAGQQRACARGTGQRGDARRVPRAPLAPRPDRDRRSRAWNRWPSG